MTRGNRSKVERIEINITGANCHCRFWSCGLLALLCACSIPSCSRKTVQAPAKAATTASDSSFLDLRPGARLKIVVPLFKPGASETMQPSGQSKDGYIVLSAENLAGYQSSFYSVVGRSDGTVRLRFRSAETTKDGVTAQIEDAPQLPFALPVKRQHVRLIYLVRQSRSDHNMAIVASKHLPVLNSFTQQLKSDPNLCKVEGEIFCSWVPAGIAVRAE